MTEMVYHWLVVGYISPRAAKWIKDLGGKVLFLSDAPSLVAVALAYNPAGTWRWSHGRQEYSKGIKFWNTGEIQEQSTGISLAYHNIEDETLAEYCSADSNYLLLPDEEFDPVTRTVKQSEQAEEEEIPFMEWDDTLGDLNDHPF